MLQAHTIFPGAVNDIPCAFSPARLLAQDDSVFLVYASGNKIVFISQELSPIEKISSIDLGLPIELQVSAVSASEFRGVVAAAWGHNLFLFHTSTLTYERKTLRLEWTPLQRDPYIFGSPVDGLVWNKLGSNLLVTHGNVLALFSLSIQTEDTQLEIKWETRLASNTRIIKFSPDGQLFATCGAKDKLVKVWYLQSNDLCSSLTRYTFVYLKHSTAVTGLSWRDTHLYMPKNGVPNALLTHTADNTAHIWVQKCNTPEEEGHPLKIYHCTTISPQINQTFISSISSDILTFAPVWVNNKVLLFADNIIDMQAKSRLNFHDHTEITTTTPAQTPVLQAESADNREFLFPQDIQYATSLLKQVKAELTLLDSPLPPHMTSQLLNKWRAAPDLILAINPLDGSILIWNLDHLDSDNSYSVKKHCLVSRMPHNIPMEEAQSIYKLIGLALYPSPIEMQHDTRKCSHFPFSEQSYFSSFRANEIEEIHSTSSHTEYLIHSTKFLVDRLYFFSLHKDGSLNVWHAIFSEKNTTCNLSGLVHMLSTGGHMFSELICKKHPSLPIIATVSQDVTGVGHAYSSDLIVWRGEHIGMLNSSGGLRQTAKLLGKNNRDFSHAVWLPTLLSMKGNLPSSTCIPTGTFLLTSVEDKLALFLTLCISPLDVWSCNKDTYTSINHNLTENNANFHTFSNSNYPTFVYKLSDLIDLSEIEGEILSIQIFSERSLRKFTPNTESCHVVFDEFECNLTDNSSYIVMLVNLPNTREQYFSVFDKSDGVGDQLRTTQTHVWRCNVNFQSKHKPVSNAILDRRISKVTLFYDMISKLESKIDIRVTKLNSEVLPFEGERLTFVEQVSQLADVGHTHFPPFLFSTLASNGVVNNWQCDDVSGDVTWVPYPSIEGGRVCLNSLMKVSNIFTPSSFMNILSVHVADSFLLAICFAQTESNSRFISILSSQQNGSINWKCEDVLEIARSSSLCSTHSVQVDWVSCRNGRFILSVMWGASIHIFAKCNKGQFRENVQIYENIHGGISPLYSYVNSLMDNCMGLWVRIAAFEAPLNRVSPNDVMGMCHVGGGALLLSVNSVLVLLSPWIISKDTPLWEISLSESISFSLFDIDSVLTRTLPQFHPYVLLELIQAGMLEHIKAILLHIAQRVVSTEQLTIGVQRSRTGSVIKDTLDTYNANEDIYDYSDLDAQLFREEQLEVNNPDVIVKQVKYIPPLPLSTFQQPSMVSNGAFSEFTPLIQSCLVRALPECSLPELLPIEEVELQAIVSTMGNMKLLEEFGDANTTDKDVPLVDECGLRYRLALKRYVHCKQYTPNKDFSNLIAPGDFVWGFHSFEQEKLLKDIPSIASGNPDWMELRHAGVCWWVRSVEMLRPFIERLAKARFAVKSDPLDAAMFYLALNKKSVLKHLFRTGGNAKMHDFFANNFTQDRWKKAAKKNAFKLMSLQRFETAVAFFLLGHSIWDAVEVCIDKLQDFQLALLITRLLEGDRGEHYQRLLRLIVGAKTCDESREIPELRQSAYYRSMAYWQLDDYTSAIDTLLHIEPNCISAPICNFYFYLKSHPLICRHRRQSAEYLTQEEVRLVFSTAAHYMDRGSPLLAMLILLKFDREQFALNQQAVTRKIEVVSTKTLDTQINTGTISTELFGAPKLKDFPKQTSDSFDWSKPAFSVLTSVDFEPPKRTERAEDYDWTSGTSFNNSLMQDDDEYIPYGTTHQLESVKENQFTEDRIDKKVVLDLRPSLLHAKFSTSLSFLCQNISNLKAVNGEVGNSSKFNTYLREFIYTELEQAAINLNINFEFDNITASLKPLLLPLAEYLTLSQDNLVTNQAPITLLYTLISTDSSHFPKADSIASIPIFLSAPLPPAYYLNLLNYANNQVLDLFNFVKKFRFPLNTLTREIGVEMILQQCTVVSHCVLTSLSSMKFGFSPLYTYSPRSTPTHPYRLSGGSVNNKLSSWPGISNNEHALITESTRKRITILLAEACGGVLLALFANAYLQQNARLMFLLLRNMPDDKMWYEVFCGGEGGPPLGSPVISILQFYLREKPQVNTASLPVINEELSTTQSSDESHNTDLTRLSVYMWSIISLCAVKKVLEAVKHISAMIGIDTELPLKSSLLCQIRTQGMRWEKDLSTYLDSACSLTEKIKSASSTDSSNSSSLRSLIIRHIRALDSSEVSTQMREMLEFLEQTDDTREVLYYYLKPPNEDSTELYKPKVLFREEDPIYSFCYSPSKPLVLALSTSKHIYEIDISRFDSGQWVEDSDASPEDPSPVGGKSHRLEDFLVVYQPTEKRDSPLIGGGAHEQTGASSSVLIKRSQHNVRRMEAHPELPYYLCGTQDGAVHLCQFDNEGIVQSLCKSHATITSIHFTHQGNKFGILDKEGGFSSCQGIYTSMSQPQKLITNCHSRSSEDFCYLSSSSFIATCGHAGDSANVRLWDLLMPPRRMIVKQFYCHPEGSTILAYSQRHQQLISGGRKGDICIFDIRQQSLIQRIEAHTDAVRAIALNNSEDFYVTGCSSGSAKLWGLTVHSPIRTFSMLHPKSSMFRTEPGITQLSLTDDGYLLSSGGDGTVRRSPVHHLL